MTIEIVEPARMRLGLCEKCVHQTRDWGDIRADLVRRTGLGRQETRIAAAKHTFLMNVVGAARRGEDFVDGRRVTFTARAPGSIVFIPAKSEWEGWDEGDQVAAYLLVSIESQFIDRTLGSAVRQRLSELPPHIGFRDTAIELALQGIAQELKHPDFVSATMVRSQAAQIFVQLLRLNRNPTRQVHGGLSPFDLKRALSMLESGVGERANLRDLAKELDLSPRHFCRAFRQSAGITPHAYLARYRLRRSADMLRSTKASITEIALDCGFGSSSYFSVVFKRAYGLSPMEFRSSWTP